MDKKDYTLAELRELGEFLGVEGIYSKRNQNKEHLRRYIYWWLQLDDQEHSVSELPNEDGLAKTGEVLSPDINSRKSLPSDQPSQPVPSENLSNDPLTSNPTPNKESHPAPETWNPAHFGEIEPRVEPTGQLLLTFYDPAEPPDPDDFPQRSDYLQAWEDWEKEFPDLSKSSIEKVNNLFESALSSLTETGKNPPSFIKQSNHSKTSNSHQLIH